MYNLLVLLIFKIMKRFWDYKKTFLATSLLIVLTVGTLVVYGAGDYQGKFRNKTRFKSQVETKVETKPKFKPKESKIHGFESTPLLPVKSAGNSLEHGNHRDEVLNYIGPEIPSEIFDQLYGLGAGQVPGPMSPNASGPNTTCTSQDLIGLSPVDLVDYLSVESFACLYEFLWSFDSNIQGVMTNAHIMEVATTAESLATNYAGTNVDHLEEMMFFIRLSYYHQYYQSSISITSSTTQAVEDMYLAFSQNVNFNLFNSDTGNIMYEWITGVDTAELHGSFYSEFNDLIITYNSDSSRWGDYVQDINMYSVMFGLSRGAQYAEPAFTNQLNAALINDMETLASNSTLISNSEYVVNQTLWAMGWIGTITNMQIDVMDAFSNLFATYPYLSQQYLWILNIIDIHGFPCPYGSITVCKPAIIPIIEALVFPNTYDFDDGVMSVQTSLAVGDIQDLYHASREVFAQFNRVTETIIPVQADPNGILTMKIYGTLADYQDYQWFLYNLSTNNGGIYIEQDGTFYTYQRTPSQSIYTLEELFRHEYVHYLVGRYLIDGMWGNAPIYSNNRMVWFDEGLAEFLTWSDRTDINVRAQLVSLIDADGANRMTVSETLNTTYGNFVFYRYAALFFNYLYENDVQTLIDFVDYTSDSDIASFDALVNQLSSDTTLEADYQQYLDDQIANLAALTDPFTVYPSTTSLSVNDPALLEPVFQTTRLGYLGECSLAASTLNSRFSCRGTLTGQISSAQDEAVAWNAFDSYLNEIIDELATNNGGVNNFDGMTCRMGHIWFNETTPGQYYPLAEYYCDGALGANSLTLLPTRKQVEQDMQSTRLGVNAACVRVSADVECTIPMSTTLYDVSVSTSTMEAALANSLIELQSSTYAIRPPYYRNLTCALQGNVQLIPHSSTEHYMTQSAECAVSW
jgi:microbial collagenase